MRYALILEYIGTAYSGSQKQKGAKTIQETLENSIRTLTKENTKTVFSGRTDKGVHARGQVVHFDSNKNLLEASNTVAGKEDNGVKRFLYSLNSLLPDDISVKEIKQVEQTFHAQRSAKYRHYRYVIKNTPQKSVWKIGTLHIRGDLNVQRMNECLKLIEGEHDFSAFKSSSENPAKICIIYSAKAWRVNDDIIIDIIGNRFLYNMVRTIVGTLLEIEKNKSTPSDFKKILESKDRTKAGPSISPEGLTLMKVSYKNFEIQEK